MNYQEEMVINVDQLLYFWSWLGVNTSEIVSKQS
jgi:hypothetical protein